MYVYCSYNDLKINIWTLKFIIKIWNEYFSYEMYINLNLKIDILT